MTLCKKSKELRDKTIERWILKQNQTLIEVPKVPLYLVCNSVLTIFVEGLRL